MLATPAGNTSGLENSIEKGHQQPISKASCGPKPCPWAMLVFAETHSSHSAISEPLQRDCDRAGYHVPGGRMALTAGPVLPSMGKFKLKLTLAHTLPSLLV